MTFRSAYLPCLLAVLAAACGGTVFSKTDDGGGATGGSTSHGGSSASAGKPSKGGSSASGGSISVGGSVGIAGSVGMAGAVGMAGGPNCQAVDCAFPVCDDGATPVTPAGKCCPICPPPPPSCLGVVCTPVMECGMGYELARPPGACCEGCMPTPGAVACPKIACVDPQCPLGYVPGDLVGGCCTDCVPDPLFCHDATECVIADRPRPCCGCPEAITTREYAADQCWSAVGAPRMIPQSCQPQFMCDAICSPCPAPGAARCIDHRCVEMDIGLK